MSFDERRYRSVDSRSADPSTGVSASSSGDHAFKRRASRSVKLLLHPARLESGPSRIACESDSPRHGGGILGQGHRRVEQDTFGAELHCECHVGCSSDAGVQDDGNVQTFDDDSDVGWIENAFVVCFYVSFCTGVVF